MSIKIKICQQVEINDGFLPLQITANGLKGGNTEVEGGVSSQYLTALLISAPYCNEDVNIKIIGTQISVIDQLKNYQGKGKWKRYKKRR